LCYVIQPDGKWQRIRALTERWCGDKLGIESQRPLIVYRRFTGWGPAALSAFGLVLLVRTILILAVTNALSKKILATPLGAVVGYIFGRANARFPTRTPSASRSPR
jgi:hypothetical protein